MINSISRAVAMIAVAIAAMFAAPSVSQASDRIHAPVVKVHHHKWVQPGRENDGIAPRHRHYGYGHKYYGHGHKYYGHGYRKHYKRRNYGHGYGRRYYHGHGYKYRGGPVRRKIRRAIRRALRHW